MEIRINREIKDYKETVFWGMSMRQFLCSIGACISAVGIYFLLKPHVGTELISWLCILASSPFVAFGFVKYLGMNLEAFLSAWMNYAIFTPKKLVVRPDSACYGYMENRRV